MRQLIKRDIPLEGELLPYRPDLKLSEEIELGMSNCGHDIDEGFEAALRGSPETTWGRHAGWNFNGRVWFGRGRFHEEVWVYGSPRKIISALTLAELMQAVNAEFGDE